MPFRVRFGTALESGLFFGRSADYLFMLLFGVLLFPISFYFSIPLLGSSLIMIMIYYWSRKNPDAEMSFMFGLQFKSRYLPWAMAGFSLIAGGNPIDDLIGIFVGHIYYFVMDKYPADTGRTLIKTPKFLYVKLSYN